MSGSVFPRSRAFFSTVLSADQGNILEAIVRECYRQVLKPGDVAVDGGAHIGLHTIPMAECVRPSGSVIAVEALSRLANGPLANAVKNANVDDIVKIVTVALGEKAGESVFNEFVAAPGYSGLIARTDLPAGVAESRKEHIVPVTTLDTLVSQWVRPSQQVRFVKLDLEGGELPALRGARRLLQLHAPLVVFEFGGAASAELYGYSKESFFQLFDEVGYHVFSLLGEPITDETWGKGYFVWYAIAAKIGSVAIQDLLATAAAQAGRAID